jgi:(p)ppGpp synthase/HD superfamily hydrolase
MDILILEAAEFATERYALGVQPFRKYTDNTIPYVVHPLRVAMIVHRRLFNLVPYNDVRTAVLAAICHDLLEDTETRLEEISVRFGTRVATLVMELTDQFTDPKLGNRATRKALERDRLAGCSYLAQCVKLADMEDNTESIVEHDPDFAKVYLKEKLALLTVLTNTPAAWLGEVTGNTIAAITALETAEVQRALAKRHAR